MTNICGKSFGPVQAEGGVSDLLALADRCEAATGPDRELDAAIHAAIYEAVVFDPKWKEWVGSGGMNVRKFTASIDAALTLVPEGWGICRWSDNGAGCAEIALGRFNVHERIVGFGYSRALAICAAALRATRPIRRGSMTPDTGDMG